MNNRLGSEVSPYLLQHANNPVWWYPWGDEAFALATKQHKPVFLSIGYSTCYWCHVMEKESFESQDVAQFLNQHFISIKVDREERPDVDQIYMDAVVGLTGHGGWPMSVFLTPGREPFWAGTYFPKIQFLRVLEALSSAWQNQQEKIIGTAKEVVSALTTHAKRHESLDGTRNSSSESEALIRMCDESATLFDSVEGGFGSAPKFPPAVHISLLLRLSERLSEQKRAKHVLHMATYTLDKMARGGIYDHVGGGFHRYSTDRHWQVPHFEKMLYDNALLAYTYLEAFPLTGQPQYAHIARETLTYLMRDLCAPEGGFYSAEDAGEVGREGEFYVWKEQELRSVLGEDGYKDFISYYPVEPHGNFEHGSSILYLSSEVPWQAVTQPDLTRMRGLLREARATRARPHRDEKILTAWNGLAISACAKAYQVLREPQYLNAAQKAARFVSSKLITPQGLLRSFSRGSARHAACLDDYAYLIEGLCSLFQADFNAEWLTLARALQAEQDKKLWSEEEGAYLYSSATDLPYTHREFFDNATPDPNATSLCNLIVLSRLTLDDALQRKEQSLRTTLSQVAKRAPRACAKALHALDMLDRPVTEVSWSTHPGDSFIEWMQRSFLPGVIVNPHAHSNFQAGSIQICREGVCGVPESDSVELRARISERKPLN